ncbi:hypothetical protein OUY22_00115 [Nonomuraea sp. MCN248]|uniref:Succinate dehydrogenase n=1 Tax=Nonomuraea corallina TaxID=2989783 RepID=A0ABT4S3S3_9ACTN|nr:hypothetical protein [Nonomuraea corallina]MDA0631806.1 hypothetical protein [Nonomuraea corallina]
MMVELPSMIAMTIHKAIGSIGGQSVEPLPIWVYRLLGLTGLVVAFFLFAIVFSIVA